MRGWASQDFDLIWARSENEHANKLSFSTKGMLANQWLPVEHISVRRIAQNKSSDGL